MVRLFKSIWNFGIGILCIPVFLMFCLFISFSIFGGLVINALRGYKYD